MFYAKNVDSLAQFELFLHRKLEVSNDIRQSCVRCVNSNRTCGGYQEGAVRVFRSYENQNGDPPPPKSTARKCSIPVRLPDPISGILPEDTFPKEVKADQTAEYALRAFFYDYCVVSGNHSLSRGYLNGLELTLNRLGRTSDLAKACEVVAFAAHGNKLNRPHMTKTAEMLYHNLLGSLARAIENPNPTRASTAASLMVAMLLGLYEMIVANENNTGCHDTHARGVAAILQLEQSPLDLFGAVLFVQSTHPFVMNGVVQNSGVFTVPHSSHLSQSLDSLLILLGPFLEKSNEMLTDPLTTVESLYRLRDEAVNLDQGFAQWQELQDTAFRPRVVGQIVQVKTTTKIEVGYWPVKVDKYFDLYVAGVWNTSRTARLLLINMMCRLSEILGDSHDLSRKQQDTIRLVDDILASIPQHLTDDLQDFVRDMESHAEIDVGRPVGGLLLMHPFYVASRLPIVLPETRAYLRDCLAWIGSNMGIGQATLFAKGSEIQKQYFADGCTIVWAGMLV